MTTNYRIREKVYKSGNKEFIPQYKDGSINGYTYAKSDYVGQCVENLPDELYWFDFQIWDNGKRVSRSFRTYDEAFIIIKEDMAGKQALEDDKPDEIFEKEIIHIIF